MNAKHTCTALMAVISIGGASATTIVTEDFESYADTVALGGVWSLGDGTLDTANGNPGQSLNHPATGGSFTGGNTNTISFSGVYPTGSETLIFSADIYDDGTSNNKRTTAGLRTASGANIIEMGMYNNPRHYSFRTILFGSGSAAAWTAFPNIIDDSSAPVAPETAILGWHRFTAEITASQVTFTLDLNSDGNINSTAVASITQSGTNEFDVIRLGGPSDLSSPGGGVKFDNVSLVLVPEPSTSVMASLGLLSLLARRRR